jgi:polycomb protein EED
MWRPIVAGDFFVSGGFDGFRIWSLEDSGMQASIKASFDYENGINVINKLPFKTHTIQFPLFATSKVHSSYADCVKWVGNLLLSKSTESQVLWRPDRPQSRDGIIVLNEYPLEEMLLWFVRFSLSTDTRYMAVGNTVRSPCTSCYLHFLVLMYHSCSVLKCLGSDLHRYVYALCYTLCFVQDGTLDIWDIDAHAEDELISDKTRTLQHPDCTTPIRMTAFSPDDTTLLACCDDASIWRWDLTL